MLIQNFLEKNAERLPDKVALICGPERYTYAEINQLANRFANTLRERGVKRGDRVVIYLPNSLETVLGIFAALKAGGTFVVCNHTTKQDKLVYILNNCAATVLISNQRNEKLVREISPQIPSLKFSLIAGPKRAEAAIESGHAPMLDLLPILESAPDHRPPTVNIDLDLAGLVYTSGSTGDPKGVMEAHSNIDFAAGSIIQYLENTEDDIVLNVLPLSFDYGLYQLLMVFKFGGTLVLEQTFTYPAAILKRIEEEKVTGFPGVPTIFAILVNMDLSSYDLSSLRYLTNTAAALPPSHIQELRNKFHWTRLYSMYGLTETKRTLYLPPEQLDIRPGSVGIAIPGTEVWIEGEDGSCLGPGEIGELVIRGRHVMRGYWENPEATNKRYRPGPLPGERVCYSDDLFRMDDDGFLYFVSRKDDIIKSRGEKVAPKEVENTLYKLDGVTEAAVIGVPDSILGEAIKAFVVTENPELTEARILAFCRANLEDFMVPKQVEFRSELPKTSSGKIKKTSLA